LIGGAASKKYNSSYCRENCGKNSKVHDSAHRHLTPVIGVININIYPFSRKSLKIMLFLKKDGKIAKNMRFLQYFLYFE
jgi:hypothetical protein